MDRGTQRQIEAAIVADLRAGRSAEAQRKWEYVQREGGDIVPLPMLEAVVQGRVDAERQQRYQRAMMPRPKNPGVAAVLSFLFAGLGQIYNGQIAKGLVFLVLYLLSWAALLIVIGVVTTPLLWLIGILDAYKTAERLNRDAERAAFG